MIHFNSKFKLFLILGLLWNVSCQSDQGKADFGLSYPDYFPEPNYTFGKNKLTKEGFELGRALFFDPILSADSTISCASCHSQGHAFADHNVISSIGVGGKEGSRNSPTMVNLAWHTSFMWDGGINHIEVMPVGPITNVVEMGESMINIVSKLNKHSVYPTRFKKVFGEEVIDDQKILYAMAQYMSMLVSDNSRYDQFRKGEIKFNVDEELGYAIFKSKCATCHTEPLFTDFSFRNNGLKIQGDDTGRHKITLDESDNYKFKVPTLRNIALTYPYMHDGRFRTLKQVVDHYADNMVFHENIDPSLLNKDSVGIPLTEVEKDQLILFLNALTDYTFTSNPLYSE